MNGPITITLHVDAALAVRAGHGRAGPAKLLLGPAELELLTERQRDTLARHVAGEPGWSRPLNRGAPPIGTADIATLAHLLDLRSAHMLDRLARKTATQHAERWPGSVVVLQTMTLDAWRAAGRPPYWDDFHETMTHYVHNLAVGGSLDAKPQNEAKDER